MLLALFYIIHVVVSLFLIGVVLLQQGKGADLAVFGGGGTMTAFGARGAATVLHKMTVISFVVFIVTTMSIGFMQGTTIDKSVMSGVDVEATAPGDGDSAGAAAVTDEAEDGATVPVDDPDAETDAPADDPDTEADAPAGADGADSEPTTEENG